MSGASVSDVNDRLSALELRVQQQEDELTVMKAALADVLRRLAASEVSAAAKKQSGGKGEQRRCSPAGGSRQLGFTYRPHAASSPSSVLLPPLELTALLPPAGGASVREAFSLSCIANGGTAGRKRERESTSVTRKETVASAAKR